MERYDTLGLNWLYVNSLGAILRLNPQGKIDSIKWQCHDIILILIIQENKIGRANALKGLELLEFYNSY